MGWWVIDTLMAIRPVGILVRWIPAHLCRGVVYYGKTYEETTCFPDFTLCRHIPSTTLIPNRYLGSRFLGGDTTGAVVVCIGNATALILHYDGSMAEDGCSRLC